MNFWSLKKKENIKKSSECEVRLCLLVECFFESVKLIHYNFFLQSLFKTKLETILFFFVALKFVPKRNAIYLKFLNKTPSSFIYYFEIKIIKYTKTWFIKKHTHTHTKLNCFLDLHSMYSLFIVTSFWNKKRGSIYNLLQ